ncbi:hypothetical protein Trydic_g6678 [Trypoxylus dichotomus]
MMENKKDKMIHNKGINTLWTIQNGGANAVFQILTSRFNQCGYSQYQIISQSINSSFGTVFTTGFTQIYNTREMPIWLMRKMPPQATTSNYNYTRKPLTQMITTKVPEKCAQSTLKIQ